MRVRTVAVLSTCAAAVAAVAAVTVPAMAATDSARTAAAPDPAALALGRQVLAANDGWAASGSGTTGGSAADDAHVFTVSTRAGLIAALGGDNAANLRNATPKIIFIKGRIDVNTDDNGNPLTCEDYYDPAYTLQDYLTAYDPATWGMVTPTGPLEEARVRSAANQRARVMINVGSNTTIIGLKGAKILGGNLLLGSSSVSVSNIIVRNVYFEDAHDCFPAWTPTDGATGNWNSLYDSVTLSRATNVWLDHNTFTDGANQDATQPIYFGRPYQVHDGASDIIRGSDFVTVSYNNYFEHDKTMLIGSTNTPGDPATNPGADLGRLRVTLHHNRFANLGQRVPRVRFGQVDVYNNYYYQTDEDSFVYAFGVGAQSAIHAENNFVLRSADIPLDALVYDWGGTRMTEKGTLTRVGTGKISAVNLLDAYNATHTVQLATDAGWTPTLRTGLDPTASVPGVVSAQAGAGKLPL
ncbi:pectate lyase [Luedemannella helvata]|uniref:Pectate lyase n=1 Tax=Luedemannella helvata TaxID=349315 RepID=A0ABP4WTM7_9ACTN